MTRHTPHLPAAPDTVPACAQPCRASARGDRRWNPAARSQAATPLFSFRGSVALALLFVSLRLVMRAHVVALGTSTCRNFREGLLSTLQGSDESGREQSVVRRTSST